MNAVFSSQNVQMNTHISGLQIDNLNPLSIQILNICRKLRTSFPALSFEWQIRNDNGVNFLIQDIDTFLSSDFEEFLDSVAETLSDEEYMSFDFIPSEGKTHEVIISCNTTVLRNNPIFNNQKGLTHVKTDMSYNLSGCKPVIPAEDIHDYALAA